MTSPAWLDSPFMKACRREPTSYTPVWLMRQAGRYQPSYRAIRSKVSFLDLCKTPDLVAQVTVDAAEQIGADAAIVFADLLLPLEPLGLGLEYVGGVSPKIANPVRQAADLARLRPFEPGALDYLYRGISLTRASLPEGTPLIGFAGAPFTLASYVIEGGGSRNYEFTKTFMLCEPAAWHSLLDLLVEALIPYVDLQISAGAGAIQLFDSWVGCLGPDDYREFVLPHSRKLITSVLGKAPVIHFATGSSSLLDLMAEAGGDVIGLDWRVDLDVEWSRFDGRAVMGNLDPAVLLTDRATIVKRVDRILDQAGGRPGHIFNLGHGILPQTPVDNVRALVDAVHDLSAKEPR